MKLLVLGASGATGGWLTRMSAQAGHEVTALVRPGATFVSPPNVRVMRGEVLDVATLAAAVDGQDAIACCLGIRRAGKAPWSALLSPPDLMTRVAGLLASAMPRAGVQRVVAISAGGVAESITQCTGVIRWLAGAGSVGVAYRDLAEMERQLSASRLDWLAVRPVTLMNGRSREAGDGRREAGRKREPSGCISQRDEHPEGFSSPVACRPSPVARRPSPAVVPASCSGSLVQRPF